MINPNIKLLAKNVTLKNIEKYFLNNINKLLYKIARFAKFLIRIATNIVANGFNTNFAPSN